MPKSRDEMERVMGLTNTVRNQAYSASRVHLVLNGLPVTVRVNVVGSIVDGRVHVKSEVRRLSGIDFTCSVAKEALTIVANGPQSGSIIVQNTGRATATGGGTANSGLIIGGKVPRGGGVRAGRPKTPHVGDFALHATPGEDELSGSTNSKATLTLTVSLGGLRYVID